MSETVKGPPGLPWWQWLACVGRSQQALPANGKLESAEGLLINLLFSSDIRVAVPLLGVTEVILFSWHCVDLEDT